MPHPVKLLLAPWIPAIQRSLSSTSQSTPPRDYKKNWVEPQGRAYRMKVYERQREGGEQPLTSNPTVQEIQVALRVHTPQSILEVGCGWGRLLEKLQGEFEIEGCDVSDEMLRLCPPGLHVFNYDIAVENTAFLRKSLYDWDVLLTRGLMLYLIDLPVQTAYAMNNMLALARKKILVWEWPEVCSRMQQFSTSDKFEYHPIEHRSE